MIILQDLQYDILRLVKWLRFADYYSVSNIVSSGF